MAGYVVACVWQVAARGAAVAKRRLAMPADLALVVVNPGPASDYAEALSLGAVWKLSWGQFGLYHFQLLRIDARKQKEATVRVVFCSTPQHVAHPACTFAGLAAGRPLLSCCLRCATRRRLISFALCLGQLDAG